MLTVYWRRRFLIQLGAQIALDIGVISLLYISAGGVRSGLAILYLFPLAGAAILAPLVLALFSASLVTLFLIGESAWQAFVQRRRDAAAAVGRVRRRVFRRGAAGEPAGRQADRPGGAGRAARRRPARSSRRSTAS